LIPSAVAQKAVVRLNSQRQLIQAVIKKSKVILERNMKDANIFGGYSRTQNTAEKR